MVPADALERVVTEKQRERHGDRAELVDRRMRNRHVRRLRRQDADAVATRNSARAKRVGEAIRLFGQIAESDGADDAVRPQIEDRRTLGRMLRPFVRDIDADVVARRNVPAEFARKAIEVADFGDHAASPRLCEPGRNPLTSPESEANPALEPESGLLRRHRSSQ